jgi:hypothetical protein
MSRQLIQQKKLVELLQSLALPTICRRRREGTIGKGSLEKFGGKAALADPHPIEMESIVSPCPYTRLEESVIDCFISRKVLGGFS